MKTKSMKISFQIIDFLYILLFFRIRDEAKELIAATERKSNTTQNDVTEKLGERVQNINYWKFELERGIQGTFMDRYVA